MPLPAVLPDLAAPFAALSDWLSQPETRERLNAWVAEAAEQVEQAIAEDVLLRVPRKPEERADGFSLWLDTNMKRTIIPLLHRLRRQLTLLVKATYPEQIAHYSGPRIAALLWTEVEPHLQNSAKEAFLRYALTGITLNFSSRRLGDNWLVGTPEFHEGGWQVPLYANQTDTNPVALVLLDGDGNILSEDTQLRQVLWIEI